MRLCLLAALLFCASVRAETILFQRGNTLYTAAMDGRDVRRLFSFGAEQVVAWNVSPDGKRVVWVTQASSAGGIPDGLFTNPATVYVSEGNGRDKRRLARTNNLRDRLNRTVTRTGTSGDPLDTWQTDSVGFSADGRTIYVGCRNVSGDEVRAAFLLDAQTGAAIVDGQRGWRSVVPMAQTDVKRGIIGGLAVSLYRDIKTKTDVAVQVVAFHNLDTARTTTFPATPLKDAPSYFSAEALSLSPSGGRVAFTSQIGGLWLLEVGTAQLRRVREGDIRTPRWARGGARMFFLEDVKGNGMMELFAIPAPAPDANSSDKPKRVLGDVTAFVILPD